MRARRWRPAVAVSASALAAAGCATIMTGTTDEITLTSEPSGARVRIQPGPERIRTPATISLQRRDGPFLLSFELEGHESRRAYIRSRPNGWIWGNLLLGGVIGIAVDWSTGALVRLDPTAVHLVLEPRPAAEAETGGSP